MSDSPQYPDRRKERIAGDCRRATVMRLCDELPEGQGINDFIKPVCGRDHRRAIAAELTGETTMRARASQVPSGYYRDNMGVVQVRPRHADMHAQEAVGNEMRWGGDPFGRVELPGLAYGGQRRAPIAARLTATDRHRA